MTGISNIKHIIMILSGKGGVGKSTIAANLAYSLKEKGYKTGLMDIDLHGPSIPRMFNLQDEMLGATKEQKLIPVDKNGVKVISLAFLLEKENKAIIWRGPLKHKLLMEFIKETQWGNLDYLIIDSPPGTGDEPLTILQNIKNIDGAVIVTTPQNIALLDVKKAIDFINQMGVKIFGIVENMSGFLCPHCNKITHIFGNNAIEKLQKEFDNIKLLGSIPLNPDIVQLSDNNKLPAEINNEIKQRFNNIMENILKQI